jgi:hypothetical protein
MSIMLFPVRFLAFPAGRSKENRSPLRASIPRQSGIDLARPRVDAAGKVCNIGETARDEKLSGTHGTSAMMAVNHDRLRRIGEFFQGYSRPLRKWQQLGSGDAGESPLI